jgi:two-component system response regulator HydG
MSKILLIEDDIPYCQMLEKFLDRQGYEVQSSYTAQDARLKISKTKFDLVLTDLRLPEYDGITMLTDIKKVSPDTAVVLMTGHAEVHTAVSAMKEGALDYLAKPFAPDEMLSVVKRALKTAGDDQPVNAKKTFKVEKDTRNIPMIKGVSDVSKKLMEFIQLVAPTEMSVLISGESGTGKEVVARCIHEMSQRKSKPFIAVDCGAIARELATSEFFGHLKGSFTGAVEDKVGHFEAANGGTLFLDEVGNLSYEHQVQLLRTLQERKIKKVGTSYEKNVDVRIITATNEDLKKAVSEGRFRQDLFHRLNEFSIKVPSLSDRSEDLELFAEAFLNQANEVLHREVQGFDQEVAEIFRNYSWPGNIRELKNVIKRAVLLSDNGMIHLEGLPDEMLYQNQSDISSHSLAKADYEKDRIVKALKQTNFNKSKAAKLLNVTRKTLYNKLNHYDLDL